jgi:peptidoglycan/xylan/chitin deacetylase (PgdA/CDA1 family)
MSAAPSDREMLTADRLPDLLDAGIEIGAHGATHIPLDMCRDVDAELTTSRRRLESILEPSKQRAVTAMSFPHGRYSKHIVSAARKAGYRFMFTSRPTLMQLAAGRPTCDTYGRIEISSANITGDTGDFMPARMAARLFRAPSIKRPA